MSKVELDQKSIEIFIVDKQGAIIFPQVAGLAPQAPQAVLSNTTSMEGWGNSLPYGNAVVPVAEPIAGSSLSWSVVVRQPVDVMLTDIHVLKKTLLASVLVVTLLTLFAIWAIAVRLSRPVEKLSQFAQQVEAGDHDAIPEISGGTHEVQQAITAVRKMSLTLIQGKQALWDANRDLEQKVAHRTEELHRLNQQLEILARTDALTGLPNRLATDETLNMEFTWFKRSHQAYSVLMMDIDHFKRVNDTYGHPVGDSVLRHFATIIRHNLRESDFVGRFGGEEFMVLLPMTELAQALAVAEKIRASVEAQPHAQAGKMTVSIGAGVVQLVDQDAGAAVGRADLALYSAKTSGRNRVM